VDAVAPTQSLVVHIALCAVNIFYIPYGIIYWINKHYLICTIQRTCNDQSFGDYLGPEIRATGIVLLVQIPVFIAFLMLAEFLKNGGRISNFPTSVRTSDLYQISFKVSCRSPLIESTK
jgi:hypothetical protein